jgi:hypothetical protein
VNTTHPFGAHNFEYAAFVFALLTVIVALCGLTPLSASGASGTVTSGNTTVLFHDDFTTDSGAWSFFNRYGRIASGRLWIDGTYMPNAVPRDGWALTHIGDSGWTDYVLGLSYDNENVGGSPDTHDAMVFFRVASEAGNVRGTMYRVDVFAAGDRYAGGSCTDLGRPWPGGWVQLSKYVNGVGALLHEECASNAQLGDNTLQISIHGGDISVVSNGQTVLAASDPDPIPYGGVGVGQLWETNGWYDDVLVTGLAEDTTPAEQLAHLADMVNGLPPGTSLAAKIAQAQKALTGNDPASTAAILKAFTKEVAAQSGKKIAPDTAAALTAAAAQISAVIA